MNIEKITLGDNFPNDMHVIIEIPMHHNPVKYEMDKASGALFVDRFISTAMYYPCNYGFVPHTRSGDGDPSDVLVITSWPIMPGVVIKTRPIGVLLMEDEAGPDEKIIALPTQKAAPEFAYMEDIEQIDPLLKGRIMHFFSHYKDLENEKWVKIKGFEGKEKAVALLMEAVQRAKK
ncbi:inorganic diphosphatase [Candidatus Cardinium hertigii]|jgi:inorganic pyrophosphatase|uniref:Inorganic pyrophosphatase n=1 Tax=Candidatus Cardinium hertigii TaxID=247481 RepID=A0A3N2QCJ5_9BACT|nr:inorganic diphosphatase [Candidatus Cardinium hertigii]ROT47332.1 inorganic diphosphatase [Candidatus Cardinium hertigii]